MYISSYYLIIYKNVCMFFLIACMTVYTYTYALSGASYAAPTASSRAKSTLPRERKRRRKKKKRAKSILEYLDSYKDMKL
jgi:hypothetical protein